MTARSVVHALLTAYLVSVLTVAWLAVMAGGLRVLGWLWAPVLTGAMAWLQVCGPDAGGVHPVDYGGGGDRGHEHPNVAYLMRPLWLVGV